MSEQSRDRCAQQLLTSTLGIAWHDSEPQARRVADAAAQEVERLQDAKRLAEESELVAAQELEEVRAERDHLAACLETLRKTGNRVINYGEKPEQWMDAVGRIARGEHT